MFFIFECANTVNMACVCVLQQHPPLGGKRLFSLLLHICMQVEMCVIYLCMCTSIYVCVCV